jgi:S1-C subfamily serine protease
MSWDQESFLAALKAAVDDFAGERTAALCQELLDRLDEGELPREGLRREVLTTLRRKCYFELMETVADALREAGLDDARVRHQYAQALVDQGKIPAAVYVLEPLVDHPEEGAEARGLLGRISKQLYVNAVQEDPRAVDRRRVRQNLQRAVTCYQDAYRSDPVRRLWHGINTVALILRAERDGVALEGAPDARQLAREILDRINAGHAALAEGATLDAWSLATALEASVALGESEQALVWLSRYVKHRDVDAFELASTERQLREVWGLTVDAPPGEELLPLLQSAALKRRFGRIQVAAPQVAATIQQTLRLEKTFGSETFVPLAWYRTGLERCRGVAQIRDRFGRGLGTGFLLRGSDVAPALGDALLLLTNAHVVPAAVAPGDAVVVFDALETVAGQQLRVAKILWSSPIQELDGTLLQLDPPVASGPEPFPIAEQLPKKDGQPKVFVIGHPLGGGLSISLTDNALLGYSDRLLHYRAPTEGGSSGSPVFDDQWRLVALHHGGGRLKRLDGPGVYDANEGIHIHRILEAVRGVVDAG